MRCSALCVWLGLLTATSLAADPYAYKLQAGQTFAYQVDLVWEADGNSEWLSGTPIFEVKKINEKDEAELLIVGRLRYYRRPKIGGKTVSNDGKDVWLATRLAVGGRAESLHGRKDRNTESLPYELWLFTTPRRILFPKLPTSLHGREGSSGSARLMETMTGDGPLGLGNRFNITDGTKHDWTEATTLDGTTLTLVHDRGFLTDNAPQKGWSYKASTHFDPTRGLVTAVEGSYECMENGKKWPPVRLQARLLTGPEEIKKAVAQGAADWKLIPASEKPVEINREGVKLFLPKHLKDAAEAKRGQWYGLQGDDHRHYLVEVLEPTAKYEVRVRYKGSKEVATVKAVMLVYLPREATPAEPPGTEPKKP